MNMRAVIILLALIAALAGAAIVFDFRRAAPHQELRRLASGNVVEQFSGDIMITNGVKHSVPLEEIVGGGPAQDGIPSIDDPKFIAISEANQWLTDEEVGLALDYNGERRFYPFKILVWHEIVNDTINQERVLITYCPLCFSGVVFDPLVPASAGAAGEQGERVEFGTSGKLWQSNLVMYDRKTNSYWSQILGEAIVGEMTGAKLDTIPSDIVKFGAWKVKNQDGAVLSKDTGAIRFYGSDPYGDYYTTPGAYFPVRNEDSRLADKEFILGVVINEQAKAYLPAAVQERGNFEDIFAGATLVLNYDPGLEVVRIFEKKADGTLERVNPLPSFWFAWAAAHPETEFFK